MGTARQGLGALPPLPATFLAKPFDLDALLALVADTLADQDRPPRAA